MAVRGVGTLIGMALGSQVSDEENFEDDLRNAGVGGIAGMLPMKAAEKFMGESGLRMRNMSEGAYSMEPMSPRNQAERIAQKYKGNLGTSVVRNFTTTVKGEQLDELAAVLPKHLDADGVVNKFDQYRSGQGMMNATPEELRLKVISEQAGTRNKRVRAIIDDIDTTLEGKGLSPGRRLQLAQRARRLTGQLERSGEFGRKYRHEIAKNEIQALSWRRKWDSKRLRAAGFDYKGLYKWGDIKGYLPNEAVVGWETDANKVSKWWGGKMLSDRSTIPVAFHTHRGDRLLMSKQLSRNNTWAKRISYGLASGRLAPNMESLTSRLVQEFTQDPRFFIDMREKDAGLTIKALAERTAKYIEKSGGLRKDSLGRFNTPSVARNLGITKQYLLGGVSSVGEYRPFMDKGQLKVAARVMVSDFQDLPGSQQLGVQKRPPLILNDYHSTWTPDKGNKYYTTAANPFKGHSFGMLDDKRLRGRTEISLARQKGRVAAGKQAVKEVIKSPVSALKYGLKGHRLLKLGAVAAAVAGSAYPLYASSEND